MKAKRSITILLMCILAAVSGAFTSCAPPPDEDKFASEDLAAEINAKISTDTSANISVGIRADVSEALIINTLITEFNKIYPNIKVSVVNIASPYDLTLASRIPAGNMTDVFWLNPSSLSYFYGNGMAFAMDNYIRDSGLNVAGYNQKATASGKNTKGHYYMMPRDYGHQVLYYNKAMFAAAGVTAPSDDWTWEDFLNICKQFKDTGVISDTYPVLDVELDWEAIYYQFIRSYGGDVIDEEGNVVLDKDIDSNLAGNAAYRYLGTLLELKQKKYILSSSGSASSTYFYGKHSPFYMHSRAVLSTAYESLGNDLGVLPIPAIGETPKISAGATGYAIYRKSANKDAAWAFIEFMLSAKGQNALAATGNIIPVLNSEVDGVDAAWRQYPSGAQLDHSKFLVNSDREVELEFLERLPSTTHSQALEAMRSMYNKVLYSNGNRKDAIQVCADTMYTLLATS